jgi:hypothetical protein
MGKRAGSVRGRGTVLSGCGAGNRGKAMAEAVSDAPSGSDLCHDLVAPALESNS